MKFAAAILFSSTFLISSVQSFSILTPGLSRKSFYPKNTLFAEPEASTEASEATGEYEIPFDSDSNEELMYALGVNLARQLGDIRPLVEDGTELTQVAKGLLDCVVGRLQEESQVELLSRRGKQLNDLIVGRADNLRKKVEDMGRNMLKEMSNTEGTITLDSGVVVHPLEPGPEVSIDHHCS